jgi:hypothetical protein
MNTQSGMHMNTATSILVLRELDATGGVAEYALGGIMGHFMRFFFL